MDAHWDFFPAYVAYANTQGVQSINLTSFPYIPVTCTSWLTGC